MIVKFLCAVEVDLGDDPQQVRQMAHNPPGFAQSVLDAFRENELPGNNYGITIYRVPQLMAAVKEFVRDVESVYPDREDMDDEDTGWLDLGVTYDHTKAAVQEFGLEEAV